MASPRKKIKEQNPRVQHCHFKLSKTLKLQTRKQGQEFGSPLNTSHKTKGNVLLGNLRVNSKKLF